MPYDHKVFFDSVRSSLFSGSMDQHQVDGMEAILTGWETYQDASDPRWLSYMYATTYHETSKEMIPIEEYNGSSQPYGQPDPETGQAYYGRGFVQLTHRENYARADSECGWWDADSCEYHAENALVLDKAARIMWFGMSEGWFRSDSKGPQMLSRYFSNTHDDPYAAREIINGDKTTVPDWSNGVSIGNLIKGYHQEFLSALHDARTEIEPAPDPAPAPQNASVEVAIAKPKGVEVNVTVTEKD